MKAKYQTRKTNTKKTLLDKDTPVKQKQYQTKTLFLSKFIKQCGLMFYEWLFMSLASYLIVSTQHYVIKSSLSVTFDGSSVLSNRLDTTLCDKIKFVSNFRRVYRPI
jgi:hypothetical protein